MFTGRFWGNNGAVQKGGLSQKRLEICAQYWAKPIRCALEDKLEDKEESMLVRRFKGLPQKICKYSEVF
jgi:hypothetical protein